MKTNDRIAVAFFAIVMGSAVGWAVIGEIAARLCDGVDLAKLNEGRPAFGCGEFWFSRYQTTVQTIVSFALTAVGLWFVVRQLRELTKQNEMTAVAFDANRRELAANRRMMIAQAVAGLDAYMSATSVLMIEAARQLGTGTPPKMANELPGLDGLVEANAKIYPALVSAQLRSQWKLIKSTYTAAYTFVLTNGLPGAGKAFASSNIEGVTIPKDHAEVLGLLGKVYGQIKALAGVLEEQSPDD